MKLCGKFNRLPYELNIESRQKRRVVYKRNFPINEKHKKLKKMLSNIEMTKKKEKIYRELTMITANLNDDN